MGWLTAIGGWFMGSSGEKNAELARDTIRAAGTWIDEQKFTPEEKSKANLELATKYANFVDQSLQEKTERSKTRRSLALFIIRFEGFFLFMSTVMYKVDPDWSKYIYKIAVDSPWGLLTLGVGAFFFGTHFLRAWNR
jgi:hypothetical protein